MKTVCVVFIIAMAATAIAYFRWSAQKKGAISDQLAISFSDDRDEDPPNFARTYTASMGNGITLKIKLYTGMFGDRKDSSELDQSNGKWVLFDAKSPADKILDRELLPKVQQYCAELLRRDKEYMDSKPDRFKDRNGQIWQRVK